MSFTTTESSNTLSTRQALELAMNALSQQFGSDARAAGNSIKMMLEQGGCGEIPPGTEPLTDAIDMAVFG